MIMFDIRFTLVKFYDFATLYEFMVMQIKLAVVVYKGSLRPVFQYTLSHTIFDIPKRRLSLPYSILHT